MNRRTPVVLWLIFSSPLVLDQQGGQDWVLPSGQTCHAEHAHLPRSPAITTVLDTMTLGVQLSDIPFLRTARGDTGLVSITYSRAGERTAVSFHHPEVSKPDARRIERTIESHASKSGTPGMVWGFVIRTQPTQVATARFSYDCHPYLVNREDLRELLAAARLGDAGGVVDVYVAIDGTSEQTKIRESSGSSEVDRALMEIARSARFEPARLDNFVVPVWVSLPMFRKERD